MAKRALPFGSPRTYKRVNHTTSTESGSGLPTQGMGFMTFDFRAARLTMVESQVRTSDVTDTDLQDAMRTIPRERFCPEGKAFLAYAETEIEYAPGQFLMAPRDIAKLLQLLKPRSGETALAIAAPYAAAVLRQMELMGAWTPNSSDAILRARDKLRCHQLPGPNPACLSVPERRCFGGQTGCSDLFCAGWCAALVGAVLGGIRSGIPRGQSAFARQVVFQNAAQGPVGAALQQRFSALQCGPDTRTRDAGEHVVVGRDMGRSQTRRQARGASTDQGRAIGHAAYHAHAIARPAAQGQQGHKDDDHKQTHGG